MLKILAAPFAILALTGCMTNGVKSDYSESGPIATSYLKYDWQLSSIQDPALVKEELSQLVNQHIRGFRPHKDGIAQDLVVDYILQTPATIKFAFAHEIAGNDLLDTKTAQEELNRRVKTEFTDRTCVRIMVDDVETHSYQYNSYSSAPIYNYNGRYSGSVSMPTTSVGYYNTKSQGSYDPTAWHGIAYSGDNSTPVPLKYSQVTATACTDKPWNFTKPLHIMSITQGPKYDSAKPGGFGVVSWIPEGVKEGDSDGSIQALIHSKREPLDFFPFGTDSIKDKTVFNALKTGQYKFLYDELPNKPELYSSADRVSLFLLAKVAAAKGAECDGKIVDYLFKIGAARSAANFTRDKSSVWDDVYECPSFAKMAYIWVPSLREQIHASISKKFFDSISHEQSNPNSQNYTKMVSYLNVYKMIHKYQSQRCVQGHREECVMVESNKSNMKYVESALHHMMSQQKDHDARDLMEQLLKNERARLQNRPQDII